MVLFLTSRIFESEEAHFIGFLHDVVEADELMDRANEIAEQLAAMPQQALRLTKVGLKRSWAGDTETALHIAAAFQALSQNTEEHRDAVEALLERMG